MSDQRSTESLHSASDLGSPTPTEVGADDSSTPQTPQRGVSTMQPYNGTGYTEGPKSKSNPSQRPSPIPSPITSQSPNPIPSPLPSPSPSPIPSAPVGANSDVLLEVDHLVKFFPV